MTTSSVLRAPDVSIVAALYFEEECVAEFIRRIRSSLDGSGLGYELILVDDESRDRTVEIVTDFALHDARIKLIELSRNNGKEVAITAGIEHAQGARIVMMDPDLQDPPEEILPLVRKLDEGYDLVFGVRRREADTFVHAISSRLFWIALNALTGLDIPENLSTMRTFNRKFAEEFKRYPERVRFIEGVFMLVGMRRTTLGVSRHVRFAGRSRYNFVRKMTLAFNAILSFSDRPLKLSVILGGLMCVSSVLFAAYTIAQKLLFNVGLAGWTSMITAIVFLAGIQTLILGLVGLYVGRTYTEVKGRPLYCIQNKMNLP
ncbi:MAG: glycosyltransferase family 2 protein [Alphaproteobacteria bacterium]|nr:glycosyltransferase family 2 protein [Alphaproteobacteria bacterium]